MNFGQAKASEWFNINWLSLNKNKTAKLIFTQRDFCHYENPEAVKFLGVMIDSTLTWHHHSGYLFQKLGSATTANITV